eukprot:TRINITY_DN26998_c0_g1_i1.p1 TRINITY_DN26998_c0_g1~~TRINITY_DN26998_c0_g1_i1.p1  ORF type:complete len:374 (+),score=46.81 TRINITY_DN26998_c0_g1_i1:29-1150(+)
MGFKKGRAARAAKAKEQAFEEAHTDSANIQHDGGSRVSYTACNGCRYEIDIATMEQTNLDKGTKRVVHRRIKKLDYKEDKTWSIWQFEATRERGTRCSLRGDLTYIQYPKWVGFALEDRWQEWTSNSKSSDVAKAHVEAWRRVIAKIDDSNFLSLFSSSAAAESHREQATPNDTSKILDELDSDTKLDVGLAKTQMLAIVDEDRSLQTVLFERLVQSKCSPVAVADGVRWLIKHSFTPDASHCRTLALTSGSLSGLRVLLVDASVDVGGLVLIQSGSSASAKQFSASSGGWIQQSKQAVKALLARGAVLGCQGSRSKLLKKLEADGEQLWANRVLAAISDSSWDVPDAVQQLLEQFLGVSRESSEDAKDENDD